MCKHLHSIYTFILYCNILVARLDHCAFCWSNFQWKNSRSDPHLSCTQWWSHIRSKGGTYLPAKKKSKYVTLFCIFCSKNLQKYVCF